MERKTIMKKAILYLIVIALLITNIILIIVFAKPTKEYYEKNYTYIGEWKYLREDDDVDRLLDRYAAPELGYKSAGAVSIEDVDITEAEAVEIAAAIYKSINKSINGARENDIIDSFCHVTYYHDVDISGVPREYYLVSRMSGPMPNEHDSVLRASLNIIIDKKTGAVVAVKPMEG